MKNKYLIFGNPISHSKSPIMYNNAFRGFNIDACYQKYKLDDGSKIKKIMIDNNIKGANITVPHKEIAYDLCDIVDTNAKDIKSVNTIICKNKKLYGYNTDGDGFIEAIKEFKSKKVLILGAGGTAKSIAVALRQRDFEVDVLNRSINRLAFFDNLGLQTYTHDNFIIKKYDLIVNTTSAGLGSDDLPLKKDTLLELLYYAKYAFDAIYGKMTPFLILAKQQNCIYKDGKDMLKMQGVLAFDIFTNHKFSKKPIEFYLKEALSLK